MYETHGLFREPAWTFVCHPAQSFLSAKTWQLVRGLPAVIQKRKICCREWHLSVGGKPVLGTGWVKIKKKKMMNFKDREKIGILGDFAMRTKVFLTTWIFYIWVCIFIIIYLFLIKSNSFLTLSSINAYQNLSLRLYLFFCSSIWVSKRLQFRVHFF